MPRYLTFLTILKVTIQKTKCFLAVFVQKGKALFVTSVDLPNSFRAYGLDNSQSELAYTKQVPSLLINQSSNLNQCDLLFE